MGVVQFSAALIEWSESELNELQKGRTALGEKLPPADFLPAKPKKQSPDPQMRDSVKQRRIRIHGHVYYYRWKASRKTMWSARHPDATSGIVLIHISDYLSKAPS